MNLKIPNKTVQNDAPPKTDSKPVLGAEALKAKFNTQFKKQVEEAIGSKIGNKLAEALKQKKEARKSS